MFKKCENSRCFMKTHGKLNMSKITMICDEVNRPQSFESNKRYYRKCATM